MPIPRDQRKCPICGDPAPFVFWIDDEPPIECPYTPAARNVTECSYQMQTAAQRARWMKAVPDAFDENGKLKPGRLADVLTAAPPDEAIIV